MVLPTLRTYLLTYMIWRIVEYTVENGKPERTIVENLYVIMSGLCNTITELHISTEEDEALIQATVNILHVRNTVVTWYPIHKRLERREDVLLQWYFILTEPGKGNDTNGTAKESYHIYLWFPKNESIVKLNQSDTDVDVIARQRRSDYLNQFLYGSNENLSMSDWSPTQETFNKLMTLNPFSHSYKDMMNWYPNSKTKVHLKDENINSTSINETLNNEDYNDDDNYMDKKKIEPEKDKDNDDDDDEDDDDDDDDDYPNWYPVNDSFFAIKRPNININRETKLIIHGFGATAEDQVSARLAYAYFIHSKYNVLLLDAPMVLGQIYFKSVKNARLLGKAIADVIIYLESFGADAADFHLLGISLGAHVAGWAGQYFRQTKGRRIGRITGLDPAGPCFAYMPANDRLDKSDALYVDVIHTNTLIEGISEPIGHSDFYVNGGGPVQQGCFLPACSHLYAAYVYKLSIVFPDLFISVKCDSWSQFQEEKCSNKTALLGEKSDPRTRGLYYIRTSMSVPYGLGINGIRPEK